MIHANMLAVVLSSAAVFVAPVQDGAPPVFSKIAFEDAVARTEDGTKVLVVKATAEWCLPCKRMDATTWVDPQVVEWFGREGLAIQLDVDDQQALAQRLRVEAMPTMIAFVKGREFDRVVGYQSADELLAWLAGVKRGERAIEAVRSRATSAPSGSKEEADARYALAKELAQSGDLDRASEEYAWLWSNTRDTPGYGGVRTSFMAGEIERLAKRHPPTRETFLAFRDEAGRALGGEKVDPEALDDWLVLNGIVGEPEHTLAWFDEVVDQPSWQPLLVRFEHRLDDVLEAAGRWADLARLYPDPVAELRGKREMSEMTNRVMKDEDAEREAMFQEANARSLRRTAGRLYACMLAAGRDEEALAVCEEALGFDAKPQMRMELVRWALRAECPRPDQRRLLDQAASDLADGAPRERADLDELRKGLERGLKAE